MLNFGEFAAKRRKFWGIHREAVFFSKIWGLNQQILVFNANFMGIRREAANILGNKFGEYAAEGGDFFLGNTIWGIRREAAIFSKCWGLNH